MRMMRRRRGEGIFFCVCAALLLVCYEGALSSGNFYISEIFRATDDFFRGLISQSRYCMLAKAAVDIAFFWTKD